MQFFYYNPNMEPKAVLSLYGAPDADLLDRSFKTVYAVDFVRYQRLVVIDVTDIISVVSMQPFPAILGGPYIGKWFKVEKSGLEDTELTGAVDQMAGDGEEDDN